ncbi:MAG: aromatic-ring-hydroxylating dioxygenase subunit beta [Pseudomonadota bacterium]
MTELELRAKVADLYATYAECICDGDIAQWPQFFQDKCLYRIVPRTNHDRGLRIGPMFAESKGALIDRVTAIKETLVHAYRSLNHTVSGVRIVSIDGTLLHARTMITVHQTLVDGTTRLLLTARTFDLIESDGPDLKFAERIVVFDSELLAGALVYPV